VFKYGKKHGEALLNKQGKPGLKRCAGLLWCDLKDKYDYVRCDCGCILTGWEIALLLHLAAQQEQ